MQKNLPQIALIFALAIGSQIFAQANNTSPIHRYALQFLPPVLIAPSNAATGVDVNGVLLTWNPAAGATSYKVELADNLNFFNTASWITAATSITTASLKQNVTYYWRVTSLNGSTAAGISAIWSFSTGTLSGVPTLSAPNNSALNISIQSVNLQWTTVAAASEYTLQWADNAQFINAQDSSLLGTNVNIGALQRSTKYFWRVRAKNVGGEGAWSSARAFTTLGLPTAPMLTYPADAATSQILTGITLRWAAVTGANTYTVQYADNPDFVNFKYIANCTSTFGTTAAMRPNTTFYWRVFAGNTLNNSTSPISVIRSFTTATGVTSPTLAAPPDGFAGINAAGATLQWNAMSALAPTAAYTIEWADNTDFVNSTTRLSSTTTLNTSTIATDKTYFWRVKATYNTGGTSDYSTTRSFSTAAANTQVIPSAPLNQANTLPIGSTNLAWTAFANATNYRVEIADNLAFANATSLNTANTNLDFDALGANTNYFWRVKATTATGTTPWSATWIFSTTAAIAAAPSLDLPLADAQNIDVSGTMLMWQTVPNAADYEVQWSSNSSFTYDVNTFYSTATNLNAVGFALSTNYYWRVRARNNASVSAWSATRKFSTLILAQATTLATPTNTSTNVAVTSANFAWAAMPFAADYDLQITANSNFSSDIRNFSVSGTNKTVDTFAQNLNYYWRVRGRNNTIESPWSAIWSFKTTQLAQAPTLISPNNNTLNITISGTNLAWNALPNATHYEVEYAPTPVFSAGVQSQIVTTTNKITLALTPEYVYYWRVRGVNAGGVSPWSALYNFTTEALANPTINATLSNVCANQTVSITADGGTNYAWSNSATTATISIAPSQTTTYTVTVTRGNGSTITLSQTITVNALPTPVISGDLAFCTNNTSTITASGAATYAWSNGTTTAQNQVTISGIYTVTATAANTCTASTSVTIVENTAPSPAITGFLAFCTNNTSTITASGAATYAWSNGTTTAQNQVTISGIYTVTATAANTCTASTSVTVTENTIPILSLNAPAGFCAGTRATLIVLGATTYQWSSGLGTAQNPVVYSAGIYTVTATDANRCTASSSVTVVEYALPPMPTISINGSTISTSATDNLQWFLNNILLLNASSPSFVSTQAGSYTVCTTNANGCQMCSQASVFVGTETAANRLGELKAYPNPFSSDFTIENLPNTVYQIHIFDATGRLLQTIKGNTFSQNISLTDAPTGIYRLLIISENQTKQLNVSKTGF